MKKTVSKKATKEEEDSYTLPESSLDSDKEEHTPRRGPGRIPKVN